MRVLLLNVKRRMLPNYALKACKVAEELLLPGLTAFLVPVAYQNERTRI